LEHHHFPHAGSPPAPLTRLHIRLEPDGEVGLEDGEVVNDISKKIFRVIGWETALE